MKNKYIINNHNGKTKVVKEQSADDKENSSFLSNKAEDLPKKSIKRQLIYLKKMFLEFK